MNLILVDVDVLWSLKMSQHRKHRGYASQRIVADYLKQHGFPFAESTGAGRQGSDITGTPCIDWEIKARADFNPSAVIKQLSARNQDGTLALGVLRLNGQGESTVEQWVGIIPLGALVQLLNEAGYGNNT